VIPGDIQQNVMSRSTILGTMDKQKLLVAVSGGIDSVVLLDMVVRAAKYDITVAHFDHGIRPDSAADARFVEGLAKHYKLPFTGKREELGANASEDQARRARYDFLFQEASKLQATIATAHHLDDMVETIIINIIRGTGWRGLAVLDRAGVVRPLLKYTKAELREYALEHRLEWVEDSTNSSQKFLRNRVRQSIEKDQMLIATKLQLRTLRDMQCNIRRRVETESDFLLPSPPYSRYFFTAIDTATAYELLRIVVAKEVGTGPTRPQLERALLAIKTAKAHSRYDIGGGVRLMFTMQNFVVETL
jgi:tRNA(Ile)-lysidine synthase